MNTNNRFLSQMTQKGDFENLDAPVEDLTACQNLMMKFLSASYSTGVMYKVWGTGAAVATRHLEESINDFLYNAAGAVSVGLSEADAVSIDDVDAGTPTMLKVDATNFWSVADIVMESPESIDSDGQEQTLSVVCEVVDNQFNHAGWTTVGFDDLVDRMSSEFEVARVTATGTATLLSATTGQSVQSAVETIKREVGPTVTEAGSYALNILDTLAADCATVSDLAKAFTVMVNPVAQTATDEDPYLFQATPLGAATATCGLALWCCARANEVASFAVSCATRCVKALNWLRKALNDFYDLNWSAGFEATYRFLKGCTTLCRTAWIDWITISLLSEDDDPDDFSVSNGAVDLPNVVLSERVVNILRDIWEPGKAICLPCIGATFYIYPIADETVVGNWKVTMVRHVYDDDTIDRILTLAKNCATWRELHALFPDEIMCPYKRDFDNQRDLNQRIVRCVDHTSKLIPLGLACLSRMQLINVGYSDLDPDVVTRTERLFASAINWTDALDLTRNQFTTAVTTFQSSDEAYLNQFVNECLFDYFAYYEVTGCPCVHFLVQEPLSGYYWIKTDAEKMSEVSNALKVAFTVAVVAAVAIVGIKLRLNLKLKAVSANAAALRLMNNPNTDSKLLYKTVKRANILSKLAGIPVVSTAVSLGTPLAMTKAISVENPTLEDLQNKLNSVARDITG